jgi:hypothetical protein
MRNRANPDLDPQLVRTSSLLARITFGILIVVVLYIGIGTWYNLRDKKSAEVQAGQGQDLAAQVRDECAKHLDFYEKNPALCTKAANLGSQPPVSGAKGERGDQGPVGPQGIQGVPGLQGPRGDTGTPRAALRGRRAIPGSRAPAARKVNRDPRGRRVTRGIPLQGSPM